MAETIEAFVQKLQAEGVQAGQDEAKKLVDDARAEAEKIIVEAKAQAEGVIADATSQAEAALARGNEELKLAARDAIGRLKATVQNALNALLRKSTEEALKDEEFFPKLLHDIAVQYAQKDIVREVPITINVDEDMLHVATHWAVTEMTSQGDEHQHIDLKGSLRTAGFEYGVIDGTIEVTPESITAVLREMIGPRLEGIIDAASASDSP